MEMYCTFIISFSKIFFVTTTMVKSYAHENTEKKDNNMTRAVNPPTAIGETIAKAPGFIISLRDADATMATQRP
jgi:hypothetical protein